MVKLLTDKEQWVILKTMAKKVLFWVGCYFFGFFCVWAFNKPPVQPPTTATNYTFKINAVPSLNQIENSKGAVLGELQTAKFKSLNQIETSNIVINNQLTNDQTIPTPTPTPTLTPTPTSNNIPTPTITSKPAPTSTSPNPDVKSGGGGPTLKPTLTPTPRPTPTPASFPTAILSPTPTPTPLAYQKTINNLSMALVTNNYQTFNSLLSNELTSTFGENAVKESFEQAQTTYGGIIAVNPLSAIQQTGNWATQEVEIKTQSGLTSKFRIILHLENGAWKLFGTQEIF